MLKLMNLELAKIKGNIFVKVFVEWLILLAMCIGMILLIYYSDDLITQIPTPGLPDAALVEISNFKKIEEIKLLSMAITSLIFIVYGSVNYSRFVVKDFAKNSLQQLYSYPVSRVKLMYAKIGIAGAITVVSMIITRIMVNIFLMLLVPGLKFSGIEWLEILTNAVAIAFMAHIAMAIGIWRKSSIATVVSAFFLAAFTQGNLGTITMYEYQFIPYIVALIGVGLTYFFVAKQKDFEFFN